MKEREAIKILRGDFSDVVLAENESHSDVFSKAFGMAIKALEKQALKTPCTIESMPKVGEWIPVTHEIDEESGEYMFTCQLPEEGERVIVVDRRGYIDIDEQCYDTDGWYLDGGDWDDIVAWMKANTNEFD